MKYVLDTTAFSAFMRRDADFLALLKGFRPEDITTVDPVVAEIQFGIKRLENTSKKRKLLEFERDRLLAVIDIMPWQPESSENYGYIKADLERQGRPIDDFDIAIAAIAMSHKCGVITANLRHFERIKDLYIESW